LHGLSAMGCSPQAENRLSTPKRGKRPLAKAALQGSIGMQSADVLTYK